MPRRYTKRAGRNKPKKGGPGDIVGLVVWSGWNVAPRFRMKIGLAYDLKEEVGHETGEPEDSLEEYDSVETVDGIASAIKAAGHSVVKLGGGRKFLSSVLREQVDLVFNISEGLGSYKSREAQVPSVLEMLRMRYSGSDPECLAVSLDKPLTKKIVSLEGVKTPRWKVIASQRELKETTWDDFPFPVFLKPAWEGSSKGIRMGSRVDDKEHLAAVLTPMLESYKQPVMVEEFISGEEVTVGIIGNAPPVVLGVMRVVPKKKSGYFVYSLEIKRDWENLVEYECPAVFAPNVLRAIEDSSLKVFDILCCRDFARVDFRVTADGTPFFLEINPLPGLNPRSSDLPIMARKMGWTYNSLVRAVLDAAIARQV